MGVGGYRKGMYTKCLPVFLRINILAEKTRKYPKENIKNNACPQMLVNHKEILKGMDTLNVPLPPPS